MNYYLVSIFRSPLSSLTYNSSEPIAIGSVVSITLVNRLVEGIVVELVEKPSFPCEPIQKITQKFYPTKILELAHFIAEYYACSLGEALSLFTPFSKQTTLLEPLSSKLNIILSEEQQKAYDFVLSHKSSLLFGDTGSGKTEIYMKLFEKDRKSTRLNSSH